jgi:indolepyruvate ferredoxin oxidoreductase alpha subunit
MTDPAIHVKYKWKIEVEAFMEKKMLSGDEAIARGAWEYGVRFAAAYPGTPSTEILENIIQYPEITAQWSPNEKVAFEVGCGASIGGARTLVAMKHVGVNVAADPLMTFAYTGVSGGFVLVSADDPSMHSSQNEQDNRRFAFFAKIPLVEPSSSQEAKDFTGAALDLSEQFDTPVMLRITTRVAHGKGVTRVGPRTDHPLRAEGKIDREKYVMLPSFARKRRVFIAEREARLRAFAETTPLNRVEPGRTEFGIITSGTAYAYVKEVVPEAAILKLGLTNPLPEKMIRDFARSVPRLFIVEELDPYLEEQIKAMGIAVEGKAFFPEIGELTPDIIRRGLAKAGVLPAAERVLTHAPVEGLTPRPPAMCPGCPHLGMFLALGKIKDVTVTGDIGCYTLGALPPVNAMDTCICMGASIGAALGLDKARGSGRNIVGVIGDSTFLHSGITGLLDAVYNKSTITVIISNNHITAMTGGQEHAGTGRSIREEPAPAVNLATLCRSLGVEHVFEADATQHKEFLQLLKREAEADHLSVIITSNPCVLYPRKVHRPKYHVEPEICIGCGACRRTACPALTKSADQTPKGHFKTHLDGELCTGCGLCASVCPVSAIQLLEKGGLA